jgi:hypothetical protein
MARSLVRLTRLHYIVELKSPLRFPPGLLYVPSADKCIAVPDVKKTDEPYHPKLKHCTTEAYGTKPAAAQSWIKFEHSKAIYWVGPPPP